MAQLLFQTAQFGAGMPGWLSRLLPVPYKIRITL